MITTADRIGREVTEPDVYRQEHLAIQFDALRERLRNHISSKLRRGLSRRIDLDDVVQDAYLDASRRIHHFEETNSDSFFIWLKLIANQTVADTLRRNLAQKRDINRDIPCSSFNSMVHPSSEEPMDIVMRREAVEKVNSAIDALKASDREVIGLRYTKQLDNKEVAAHLGITEKAASIRFARALKRLRAATASLGTPD